MERWAYCQAGLIATRTDGMGRGMVSKGVEAEKGAIFPMRADEQLFKLGAAAEGQSFRLEHGLEGKFLVVHSGNMGVKQGLAAMLEAAALLKAAKHSVIIMVGRVRMN